MGHATANLAVEMELTGQIEAVLYDIFVLPEYRQQGISNLLSDTIENLACQAKRDVLNGTVLGRDETHARQILDRLKDWNATQHILVREVRT